MGRLIPMLDTSTSLETCEREMEMPAEQLLTPLTRFRLQRPGMPFCVDNGAFAGFKAAPFLRLLEREEKRIGTCRFVAAPDVVANAKATLEAFYEWMFHLAHWPLALVLQDGMENESIPWFALKAVFVGGSTEWKMSNHALRLVAQARDRGLWVHVGRVNTPGRWRHFEPYADSVDGTGISRFSWMRRNIAADRRQGRLFAPGTARERGLPR